MSPREPKDLAASIRQRLLNSARERGEDFQLVLTWYGIERLLYRLSRSRHHASFVLKGAMLFSLWSEHSHRPTRDLDLLGLGDPYVERLEGMFGDLCDVPCSDGIVFDPSSVRCEQIRPTAEHGGVRTKICGELAGARVPLQVDIGFGDVVVPPPEEVDYPSLLDLPAPRLRAYPREVVLAEKFQALVRLGMANTRMKDFHDIWTLAMRFDFQGERLANAISATFERRRTPVPAAIPLALTSDFFADAEKVNQWRAFLRRGAVAAEAELEQIAGLLEAFLMPPSQALSAGETFRDRWPSGGPWRTR